MQIEARLDLHGMTQAEAHQALHAFIERQARLGARCLLVITGKGRGGDGVLRAALPGWLNAGPIRAKVLAIFPAQPKDGGSGAVYVYLKRQRPD